MSTRYRTTYHGILLGLLLHVIMAQAVNAQRSLSERLDYFRSLGERTELELEEIRTPIVSYQTLMDSDHPAYLNGTMRLYRLSR